MPLFRITRLYRFGLRTMLVLIALIALPSAWVASQRAQSRRELDLAAQFHERTFELQPWHESYAPEGEFAEERFWHPIINDICGPRVKQLEIAGPTAIRELRLQQGELNALLQSDPHLEIVTQFTTLKNLDIDSIPLRDLRSIGRLRYLIVLTFIKVPVSDLTPLADLPYLEILEVSDAPLSDLTPLSKIESLTYLDFSKTKVSDLAPLAGLKNLDYLVFDDTEVADLGALKDLSRINKLRIARTEVSDLSPLYRLPNLIYVDIEGCPVSAESLAEFQQELPNCKVGK